MLDKFYSFIREAGRNFGIQNSFDEFLQDMSERILGGGKIFQFVEGGENKSNLNTIAISILEHKILYYYGPLNVALSFWDDEEGGYEISFSVKGSFRVTTLNASKVLKNDRLTNSKILLLKVLMLRHFRETYGVNKPVKSSAAREVFTIESPYSKNLTSRDIERLFSDGPLESDMLPSTIRDLMFNNQKLRYNNNINALERAGYVVDIDETKPPENEVVYEYPSQNNGLKSGRWVMKTSGTIYAR